MHIKLATKQTIEKVLVGASMGFIAFGPAAPAGAASNHHSVQAFLAAVRAVGITGTDPAMLEDGYDVCWKLWNQHSPGKQVVADTQKDHPQLTIDQATHFVIDAYTDLCPVPGAYDYWAYSTEP